MEGDENWENYLLLLRIVDYLFAPVISYEETVYLKVSAKFIVKKTVTLYKLLQFLIEQHHEAFAVLYPIVSITPKMHYMIHMPRIIAL